MNPNRPPVSAPAPRTLRTRAGMLLVAGSGMLVLAAALGLALRGGEVPAPAQTVAKVATQQLRQGDLTIEQSFDGTIGPTEAAPATSRTSGVVTELAPEGAALQRGAQVLRIGNAPMFLFFGAVPAWRDIGPATTPGADVAQLEENLVALGFDPDGSIQVDSTFTGATAAAVVRWQQARGLEATGTVTLGSVAFASAPVAVGKHKVEVGGSVAAGAVVTQLTTSGYTVSFTVGTDVKTLVRIGQPVDVTMPDYTTAKATITAIGTTTDSSTGQTTSTGTVVLTDPARYKAVVDKAPVKVKVVEALASNVLVAPAEALAAYIDGSYSVGVAAADGSVRTVRVTVGVAAGGNVAVTGDGLRSGDRLVVPGTV